jgi:excisionase family DNA binding protein
MPQYSLSRLLTVDETAEYLGVSAKTVDRYRIAGKIPFTKIDRWIRIKFGDLLAAPERYTQRVAEDDVTEVPNRRRSAGQTKEVADLIDAYGLASALADDAEPEIEPKAVAKKSKPTA